MAFHIKQFRESALGKAQWAMLVNARAQHAKNEQNTLQVNSALTDSAWVEIDRAVSALRTRVKGFEIVEALDSVVRPVDLGKYALEYTMAGDIDSSVAVDMDGSTPVTYDHTAYDSDGDPIPFVRGGFGVGFRQQASLETIDINLLMDSERAKILKVHQRIADLMLAGDKNIKFGQYPSQGLKNHRNTAKIDLKTAGEGQTALDLTVATPKQWMYFFTNVFGKVIDDNEIGFVTKIFVSYEIYRNLQTAVALLGDAVYTDSDKSVFDMIKRFIQIDNADTGLIPSYGLSGNELLSIKVDREYVEKLVGQGMLILPLPRETQFKPQNVDIVCAQGIAIKRDFKGRSGVIYAGDLT